MTTQCTSGQLEFQSLRSRRVTGRFDGGRLTSDGGGVLLREVAQRLDLFSRLAGCFTDYRRAGMVEHPVQSLPAQRIYGLALGYEDINDHDTLRSDSLLALLVGKQVEGVLVPFPFNFDQLPGQHAMDGRGRDLEVAL